jgi:hypothetical protein
MQHLFDDDDMLWIYRPVWDRSSRQRSYSLSQLEELSALLELDVDDDDEVSSDFDFGPSFGQQTLQ